MNGKTDCPWFYPIRAILWLEASSDFVPRPRPDFLFPISADFCYSQG